MMSFYKKDYTLIKEQCEGCDKYFAAFQDTEGFQKIEVSEDIYSVLLTFNRIGRNCQSWTERNTEHSELTEETLHNRTFMKTKSVERIVIDRLRDEQLWLAIWSLPEIQMRRIVLYYFYDFTYDKIAQTELDVGKTEKKCTPQAVKVCIDTALKNLKRILRNRL